METSFRTGDKDRKYSEKTIKPNEMALPLTYMGWRKPCIEVEEVSPQLASLLFKRKEKLHISQMTRSASRKTVSGKILRPSL